MAQVFVAFPLPYLPPSSFIPPFPQTATTVTFSKEISEMRNSDQGFGKRRMALNKVTFLLLFSVGTLLFTFSVVERSTEPEESFISRLELRRATLLKHCSTNTKKSSQEQSMKQLHVFGPLKLALKNLHFIRHLPGDLVFCLLKKAGSTSLTHFFTNNLEPADEVAWLDVPDEETQEQIVKSRSSLRVMVYSREICYRPSHIDRELCQESTGPSSHY